MKSSFKEGRYGFAFKNGKLYWFAKRHVVVMASWPDPRAWLKRPSHDWKASRKWADMMLGTALFMREEEERAKPLPPGPEELPSGQYLLPGIYTSNKRHFEEMARRNNKVIKSFFETFPPDTLAGIRRFSDRRWHVLNLLVRCPGADDLGRGNPALLYALASNWVFHKPAVAQPIRAARSLVNRKQKHILEWLGFPPTETTRRILCKIVPASLSVESLLYLRGALEDPYVSKRLSHLERINAGVLRLVTDLKYRSYLTPRLLEDIGCDPVQDATSPPVFPILLDTIKMAGMVDGRHCPPQFASLKRLSEVHDELSRRLRPEMLAEKYDLPARFPDPPYVGTDLIRPIMTPDELAIEGLEMRHCSAVHAVSVARGEEFIYRVIAPVRATMAVSCHGGHWQRSQLFKARNEPVPPDLGDRLFEELFRSGRLRTNALGSSGCAMIGDPMPARYDPKQLPLLPPDEMSVYWQCVEAFREEKGLQAVSG